MTPVLAPQDAIEVAATIGFGIARRALWSGDRCTWFDAIPTMPAQNPATSTMSGPDLYGGTSGIGWFLAQAAARSGDALLHRTARGALHQAAARADEYAKAAPHGFYGGGAGVGAALVLAGSQTSAMEEDDRGGPRVAAGPADGRGHCRRHRHHRRHRGHNGLAGARGRRAWWRRRIAGTRRRIRRTAAGARRTRRAWHVVVAYAGRQARQSHRIRPWNRRHRARPAAAGCA